MSSTLVIARPASAGAEPWNVSRRVSDEVDVAVDAAEGGALAAAGALAATLGAPAGRRTGPRRIVSSDARYAVTYTPQRGQRSPVTSAAPQRGQASGTGGLEQRGQRTQRVAQPRPVPGERLAVHQMDAPGAHRRHVRVRREIRQVGAAETKRLVRQQDDLGAARGHLLERHGGVAL